MNKKEVFLRILKDLEKKALLLYLCRDSVLYANSVEHQAFRVWIMGMLQGESTVIDWLDRHHPEHLNCNKGYTTFAHGGVESPSYKQVKVWPVGSFSAYRKAWIKHLIIYLESLP